MKRLVYFLIFLLFTSCATNPPDWYNKIYTDNNYYIYATGSGKTKQDAINSALANASAKIAIVVKSLYKSQKYSYKGDDTSAYSNTSIFDIQTKTNPITFTDYKILKLDKKDKFYVLIKINRYKNAKYMCDNTNLENINTDNLNLLFNYKNIINKINKTITKLKNINALYPICKEKLHKAIELKENIQKKYNNLTYTIKTNDNNIKNIIESAINIKNSKNSQIKIIAKSFNSNKIIGDYKISIINLNLKIISNNSSKSFEIKCAGNSIQDFSTAKSLAYENCKEKIKRIFNN